MCHFFAEQPAGKVAVGTSDLQGITAKARDRSDLIILSMTQTAFVLDHEEYVPSPARKLCRDFRSASWSLIVNSLMPKYKYTLRNTGLMLFKMSRVAGAPSETSGGALDMLSLHSVKRGVTHMKHVSSISSAVQQL